MPAHRKLGKEKCPICGEIGRVKFKTAWNAQVKFTTKNKYVWFTHNDRTKKDCYSGSYDEYLEKQIEDHPLREIIQDIHKYAEGIRRIVYYANKLGEKYVKSWPLTREEDKKLAAAMKYQREVLLASAQLMKFNIEGLLLRMSGTEIPKERIDQENKTKSIFSRQIEEMDKLKIETPLQLLKETKKALESDPFSSIVEPLFKKYELPKREAKAKQLKPKLSEGHFGSEKFSQSS